jgi:hypothetical protein
MKTIRESTLVVWLLFFWAIGNFDFGRKSYSGQELLRGTRKKVVRFFDDYCGE